MSGKKEKRKRKNAEIFADLRIQLRALGYHYSGTDLNELRLVVRQIEEMRKDKPGCWALSFDPKAEACLRCETIRECGEAAIQPQFDLVEPAEPVRCSECDGDLVIELSDESGRIVDAACSSHECFNTLRNQTGHAQRDD